MDCSIANALFSTVCSSKGLPINCKPKGRLFWSYPAGIEIAGNPAKFAGTVNTSFKYIAIGSSMFSPIAKADEGVVGVSIVSTFLKASSKSFLINLLTFCAFK